MAIRSKNGISKICSKCRIDKPLTDFALIKSKGVLKAECRVCINNRKIKQREGNIDSEIQKRRAYYHANRDTILLKEKARASKKKDRLKAYHANYRNKNRESLDEQRKVYIANNKAAYDKRQRDYRRNRRNNDVAYNILCKLRNRVWCALKRDSSLKVDKTAILLGCTIPEFKSHFASLFTEGMTWQVFLSGGIHIDHIKPCIKFDLTNEDEQRACFHYTNLQPLWERDNLIKGDFYEEEQVA